MVNSKRNHYRDEFADMLSTFALISKANYSCKGANCRHRDATKLRSKTKECFTDFNLGCRSILAECDSRVSSHMF